MTSFKEAFAQVHPGSIDEANLIYDAAFMQWCIEFNREPSLRGLYLQFDSWDAFDAFASSLLPQDGRATITSFEKAASLYEVLYSKAVADQETLQVVDLGIKLTNALDKLAGKHEMIERIQNECLEIAIKANELDAAGNIYLSQAHTARYRTYDSSRAFLLLRKAQECFTKQKNDDRLHHAYMLEMSILDPQANDGADADLERYMKLYELCVAYFQLEKNYASLVELHIAASQRLEIYKRFDLVEQSLVAMLKVVKQHFPDRYDYNLEGVKDIFADLGIDASHLASDDA